MQVLNPENKINDDMRRETKTKKKLLLTWTDTTFYLIQFQCASFLKEFKQIMRYITQLVMELCRNQ